MLSALFRGTLQLNNALRARKPKISEKTLRKRKELKRLKLTNRFSCETTNE